MTMQLNESTVFQLGDRSIPKDAPLTGIENYPNQQISLDVAVKHVTNKLKKHYNLVQIPKDVVHSYLKIGVYFKYLQVVVHEMQSQSEEIEIAHEF